MCVDRVDRGSCREVSSLRVEDLSSSVGDGVPFPASLFQGTQVQIKCKRRSPLHPDPLSVVRPPVVCRQRDPL